MADAKRVKTEAVDEAVDEVITPVREIAHAYFQIANRMGEDSRIITVCMLFVAHGKTETHVLRMPARFVFADETLTKWRQGKTSVFNVSCHNTPVLLKRFAKHDADAEAYVTAPDRPFFANACKKLLQHQAEQLRLTPQFTEEHKHTDVTTSRVESERVVAKQIGAMNEAELVQVMQQADKATDGVMSDYFAPLGSEPLGADAPGYEGPYDAVVIVEK